MLWAQIQNTREIKRTHFNRTKQDKTCKFSRKSSFSSYVQHKNRKTNNEFNLSCVSWIWEAGGRERARDCFEPSQQQRIISGLKSQGIILGLKSKQTKNNQQKRREGYKEQYKHRQQNTYYLIMTIGTVRTVTNMHWKLSHHNILHSSDTLSTRNKRCHCISTHARTRTPTFLCPHSCTHINVTTSDCLHICVLWMYCNRQKHIRNRQIWSVGFWEQL